MSVPPRKTYVIRTAAGFILTCALAGFLYSLIFDAGWPWSIPGDTLLNGIIIGTLIGVFITAAELRYFQTSGKRLKFLPYLLLQSGYYLLAINVSVVGVSVVHAMLSGGTDPSGAPVLTRLGGLMSGPEFIRANLSSLGIVFLINFIRQVNRMLGHNALLNFATGKYHSPVEEERVFMFLDLKAAAEISESLGHKRYHEFLNDFFFDITPAIVESQGEITQYTDDEVVVTWAKKGDSAPADSVYCYFRIAAAVARTSDRYENTYGHIPEFRAGIHYGPVVTGFIGDVKRDVVFHGDTVLTASRIRTECSTVNKNLLLSGELLRNVNISNSLTPERIGRIRLKGKEKEIELYTLAEAA